jgi:hypothetical protein
MHLPSNTVLQDFIRHHQPEPDSPLSWLVEKCDALLAERNRLVEALDAFVNAQEEADSALEQGVELLTRLIDDNNAFDGLAENVQAEVRELQAILESGRDSDLPDVTEWCGS